MYVHHYVFSSLPSPAATRYPSFDNPLYTVGERLGLVNYCDKSRTGERVQNAMMLEPNSDDYDEVRNECFRRASYLAKVNKKNTQQKWQREYFASRIPKECR